MALGQNIPLFFRLYHKLKHDIVTGNLPKGTKINTIEELAQQHGVSQASIRKSLDLLEGEGLLDRKQGWGTFVPENVDLQLVDLGVLITSKGTVPEAENAHIEIISAEWVEANSRLTRLMELTEASSGQSIYKIYARIVFKKKLEFKALVTYYFPKKWMRIVSLEEGTPPRDIIVKLAEWMEATPLRMSESLLPFLCTDENAELLGLPDGTPVFYQTFVIKSRRCQQPAICWDMINSANIFKREQETN